jgi:ATPase, P-type (transporting), HAD superfamily, subfamily IC
MGKPLVSDIKWFGDRSPQDLASIVYSLETRSQHPLAESLCKYLKAEFPEIINAETSVTGFTEKRGAGVQAEISAKSHFAGNEAYMRDMNVPINSQAKDLISELKTKARTLILVGNSDELLALIGMSDTLKPGAAEAVIEFNNMGIEVIMLTGDQPEAANFIAGQAGIKRVIAGALPHEKGDFIKKLQAENRTVAMIGDGINDSYALAQADVGIAMAKGSDIALDSAGITLMGSNLKQAVAAFRLSKAIIRKIRQNLFWAFSYNIIAIPLAAGVLFPINGMMLSPMIAGAAMAMSSVSVVVNSLRLLSVKI